MCVCVCVCVFISNEPEDIYTWTYIKITVYP